MKNLTHSVSDRITQEHLDERFAFVNHKDKPLRTLELEAFTKHISQKLEYIDHPTFQESNAFSKIFEHGADLPDVNSSWYHPAMDKVNPELSKVENKLLTTEQEVTIFLRFNYARYRAFQLQEKANKPGLKYHGLSIRDARAFLNWFQMAMELRSKIAEFNLGLVLAMIRRFDNSLDYADMLSEGNIVLLYSIDKFDVGQGYKFSTYACRSILRALAKISEKQMKRETFFTGGFDETREKTEPYDFEEVVSDSNAIDRIKEILRENSADLSDIEKTVLHYRFPLKLDMNAQEGRSENIEQDWMTLRQLGSKLGYTKERIRQIQFAALDKIRLAMHIDD